MVPVVDPGRHALCIVPHTLSRACTLCGHANVVLLPFTLIVQCLLISPMTIAVAVMKANDPIILELRPAAVATPAQAQAQAQAQARAGYDQWFYTAARRSQAYVIGKCSSRSINHGESSRIRDCQVFEDRKQG